MIHANSTFPESMLLLNRDEPYRTKHVPRPFSSRGDFAKSTRVSRGMSVSSGRAGSAMC